MLDAGLSARTQLLTSIMAASVEDAAAQGRQALDRGFRALLATPPFFFRAVDDEGIFRWYAALIERLGSKARDLIAYHLPSVTGIALSPDLIGRLKAAFPGVIVGVKDSSASWSNTERLLEAHADLMILVGDERDLARAVQLGGSGAISRLGNIAPAMVGAAARLGQDDPRIRPLVDVIVAGPVLASIKAIIAGLAMLDGSGCERHWPRSPSRLGQTYSQRSAPSKSDRSARF